MKKAINITCYILSVLFILISIINDIKKSNVRNEAKLDKNTWHQLAMTWDGDAYSVDSARRGHALALHWRVRNSATNRNLAKKKKP